MTPQPPVPPPWSAPWRTPWSALPSRSHSPLVGAFNFRDIGGLPTSDGRGTRRGVLFRSDTLQALTDDDTRLLGVRFGVRRVLDLRGASEATEEGTAVLDDRAGCYVNVPLLDVDVSTGPPGTLLRRRYVEQLGRDDNLVRALTVLAHLLDRPVVVHCAAGKDRTGVLIALTLGLVGVCDEVIAAEYLLTAPNMPRIVRRFATWPRYRRNMANLPSEIYECTGQAISGLLDAVHTRYGGFAAWAGHRGVPPSTVRLLRERLLEPPVPDTPKP